ncbi:MAG: hypothetical protein WDA16_13035, partial [Candidatus Thermoplasmatota archaeon]
MPLRPGNPGGMGALGYPSFGDASRAMPSEQAPSTSASMSDAPMAASSWAIVDSPNTGDGQTTNLLPGVTCVSAADCWAVGYYDTGNTRYQTLIQRWDGASWARVASPNTATTQDNRLQGVTCASTSDCWAVGYSGGTSKTLIEHWNGAAWTIVPSPNTGAAQSNYLYGAKCNSATDCWAVGYYLTGGTYQTLAVR